jgi:hypothetical protein
MQEGGLVATDLLAGDPLQQTVAVTSSLDSLDFARADQPAPTGDPRRDLLAWLEYQRHEFLRKLRDLTPDQASLWSVPPVQLSVLGLVRHMRQMEHFYLAWGVLPRSAIYDASR